MPIPSERHYTIEEYFAVEETSSVKHEFYQGQIFAMAGASLAHNRLTGNVFSALRIALAGSACEVFASDLRLWTPGGLYTYPDVMAVCGGVELRRADRLETVVNPVVIVEVLAASTAAYDCGEKRRLYQTIPTLRDYLLIDQAVRSVSHYTWPGPDHSAPDWPHLEYRTPDGVVRLSSLGVRVALVDLYAGVELP